MRKFIYSSISILLLALTHASSQPGQESWARQIFAPSAETLKAACELAFEYPANVTIGEIRVSTSAGRNLFFKSPVFFHYGLCQVAPDPSQSRDEFLSGDMYKTSVARVKLFLLLAPKGGSYSEEDFQTTTAIVLSDASEKEVLRLKPKPNGAAGSFEFDLVKVQQQTKLDLVKSFTIVLTSKTKVEKLKLDPSKFTVFTKVER
jgi:hypothetical protein